MFQGSSYNYSLKAFDEGLLDLYDEQFSYNSFKELIHNKSEESHKVINELINQFEIDTDDDVNLKVNLSDEVKEKYKQGLIKFDKDKDGNMYAQLRENGKYGKKLTISEETKQTDLVFAAQLNNIKDVLFEIVDLLENIEECVNNVLTDLHNDRVGLYYSGISIYLEALQTTDTSLQKQLIAQSIKSLSDSQAQIMQELKSDVAYLKSSEYQKIKKKKHERLVEKMQNIHECYQTINRIITLKAMIYFDNNQLSSMLMVCKQYQRFIDAFIKPNAAFLIECDPRDDKLINGVWNKRANAFIECKELQNVLNGNDLFYIEMEDK